MIITAISVYLMIGLAIGVWVVLSMLAGKFKVKKGARWLAETPLGWAVVIAMLTVVWPIALRFER